MMSACLKHQELALQTEAELSKDGTQFNFPVLFDMMLVGVRQDLK